MNDAAVKAAVDRFLKQVNFTAQREIEKVVRNALASGKIQSGEAVSASVKLTSDKVDLNITIFSKIEV
jgi:hypothetical protein